MMVRKENNLDYFEKREREKIEARKFKREVIALLSFLLCAILIYLPIIVNEVPKIILSWLSAW